MVKSCSLNTTRWLLEFSGTFGSSLGFFFLLLLGLLCDCFGFLFFSLSFLLLRLNLRLSSLYILLNYFDFLFCSFDFLLLSSDCLLDHLDLLVHCFVVLVRRDGERFYSLSGC